jgi:3-isopropylmalate/(R)-2-methylmalate dehydratase small subunit
MSDQHPSETRGPWPERCPIIAGRAWAFGLGVTADLIVPYDRLDSPNAARWLMTAIDPSFPTRLEPGDILVGGGDFAAGTRDARLVGAILDAGVAALIDPEFARLAFEEGLVAVEVNESLAIHTGEHLRVDLEGLRVVNLSSGDRYPIRNVTEAYLERFRALES